MINDTAKEVISYKKVVRQEVLSFKTSVLMSFLIVNSRANENHTSESVFGVLSERVLNAF